MKLHIKFRKWHKILLLIFLLIFILLFFLSTILKAYIVKNSEKLIGRKIELKELHINYITVSVLAKGFVLYEKDKNNVFVSFDELYVNFSPWHLLKREYAFSEIRVIKPFVSVVYTNKGFNFNDLITSSDTIQKPENKSNETVKYLVENISIKDGAVVYEDKIMSNRTDLKNLGLNIPKIAWNNSKSDLGVNFILGEKGKVHLDGFINQQASVYVLKVKTENIDIQPFEKYTKPYLDAGLVQALLHSDVSISGSMNDPMNVIISGECGLKDLLINDINQKHVCSATEVNVVMDTLDIKKWNFSFHTVKIDNPKLTVNMNAKSNTIYDLFAPYFKSSSEKTTKSKGNDSLPLHYTIDNMIVNNATLNYSDFTLHRPFHFDVDKMNIDMKGLGDLQTSVPVDFSMTLNHTGSFKGKTIINMLNPFNIKFDGAIKNLDMICLSPYFEYYVARPITRGRFNYDCKLAMTSTKLSNENKIKIEQLETGHKTKDKPVYKVPVGLALYILKDRNGNIAIDLPVSGNPKDPKFKLNKIIWSTLEEFLLKTITSPFKAIGNLFGSSPEDIKQLNFEFLQDSLNNDQKDKLDKIAGVILKKPELQFNFVQSTDPQQEKDLIALRSAKMLYLKTLLSDTSKTGLTTTASEIKDNNPEFCSYLGIDKNAAKDDVIKACYLKTGNENVLSTFNQLLEIRNKRLSDYMNMKGLPQGSVVVKTADFRNLPDELKKPQFIVDLSLK